MSAGAEARANSTITSGRNSITSSVATSSCAQAQLIAGGSPHGVLGAVAKTRQARYPYLIMQPSMRT